jgi:hypothetical protein
MNSLVISALLGYTMAVELKSLQESQLSRYDHGRYAPSVEPEPTPEIDYRIRDRKV